MQNSKKTKTILLLMFSLFIVGFSINQARADVRMNIGLGYSIGNVDHRHHHAPLYNYNRQHYYQPKEYYSKNKYHHPKSYRGYGKHIDHYRYESRDHHRYYR